MITRIEKQNKESPRGFTLLELLIVIAIISILFVAVVVTLNPAETLKKARDTQRVTDLSTLKTAISLYVNETPSPSMGTHNKVYLSVDKAAKDATAKTPSGVDASSVAYSNFVQVATANLIGDAAGSGWIPINFAGMSIGSPLSNLPKDPVNTLAAATPANSDLCYRYVVDANYYFEIDATFESTYYKTTINLDGSDGGNSVEDVVNNVDLYEVGTKLNLIDTCAGT